MKPLTLLRYPHQALVTPCQPAVVEDVTNGLFLGVQDLLRAEKGLALAANQIGIFKSWFMLVNSSKWTDYIVRDPTDEITGEAPIVWINPVIISGIMPVLFEESCLSIPKVTAKREFFSSLRVEFTDQASRRQTINVHGLLAFVVAHECNHLAGKLMPDLLTPAARAKIQPALNKLRRK